MKELRIRNGKLEHVVREGYGQSVHSDIKILKYNPTKDAFEGRVWNGNFGPGDNTVWSEVPFSAVAAKFGQAATEALRH